MDGKQTKTTEQKKEISMRTQRLPPIKEIRKLKVNVEDEKYGGRVCRQYPDYKRQRQVCNQARLPFFISFQKQFHISSLMDDYSLMRKALRMGF